MLKKKDKQSKPIVDKKLKKPKKVKNKREVKNRDTGERKNLLFRIGTVGGFIVFAAALFFMLSSIFSTETYYVLNQNVKAKELITPEMVTARETGTDTGPINALDMSAIQRGEVYSRYPLYAGDVIASSNSGPVAVSTLGIPDDWLVTSFSVVSTDAVGGTLGRGDYIDLIGVSEAGAQYVFNNLLVLEVKFVNEELDGKLDGQTVVGEAMHYTVGLPADAVAYLHSALLDYDTIKIVKSPIIINYADRDTSDLDRTFKYGPEVGNIDLIDGTDPTFTDIERDEEGRPTNVFDGEESSDKESNVDENDEQDAVVEDGDN